MWVWRAEAIYPLQRENLRKSESKEPPGDADVMQKHREGEKSREEESRASGGAWQPLWASEALQDRWQGPSPRPSGLGREAVPLKPGWTPLLPFESAPFGHPFYI